MGAGSLPRIERFLGTDDCGPSSATYSHCGAPSCYVIHFQGEDGRSLGAMRGDVQVTTLVRRYGYLKAKEAGCTAPRLPWKLSARDVEVRFWGSL